MGLRTAARLFALGCAALTGSAAAQVNLPALRLPSLPPTGLDGPLGQTGIGAAGLATDALAPLRQTTAQNLIRQNLRLIEADPNGEPMLRGQLIALDLSAAALERAVAAGFVLLREQPLEGLQSRVDVLQTPPGMSTRRALRELRGVEPSAMFDYDHIYEGSAAATAAAAPMAPSRDARSGAAQDAGAPPGGGQPIGSVRIGLIDGGVQLTHAVFHDASITVWGCDAQPVPSAHGTAVGSLLIGDAGQFHGAAPGARLYAADVYCGQPTGGAVDAIAAALGWLDTNQVAVVNISLVGPDNMVLRRVVQQMIARGHIIVAAVGNDGPAAPPLYPAAYPDVVGVTAVDAHRHALIEAERGAQVEFAAPGGDMAAANYPDGYTSVRGTSFAAPLVAGLLARRVSDPDPEAAHQAIESLAREAIHLGARGRDSTYGLGLVAEGLRVAPDIMQAQSTPLR
jgi:subtilisin family serine protease